MLIYKVTNKINGKIYIGQTTRSLHERWRDHLCDANHNDSYFYSALSKYGPENFVVEEIVSCTSLELLNELEKVFIEKLDCRNSNVGYNILPGGRNKPAKKKNTPKTLSATHKKNISIGRRNYKPTEEELERLRRNSEAMRGVPLKPEHKDSMSISLTGIKRSPETKVRMSISRRKRLVEPLIPKEQREKIAVSVSLAYTEDRRKKHSNFMIDLWAKRKAAKVVKLPIRQVTTEAA